ncbi:uncharacterized protein LOC124162178 isoform X2 [Ischnura elegans]|uniref:uncharacterized protein LOC124162178 isoform X2 n=1 Tax=Ischnura elegans TaxID=197161 RepID=UPI001ED89640|nr:uncharacterized protein LOC124162178 isoform X2 [Ischnura elegans]
MAPGVNGSGKHTGTVPKSKTQNDGRREPDNRRDPGINNMSNNLAPFDWQQIPESSQSSSLKPSNTRGCDSDCYDIEGAVSHDIDNRRRRVSDEQGVHHPYLPFGYPPASVKPTPNPRQLRQNAHRLTCYSQPSLHSSHINQPHAAFQMMMASDEEEGASSFDSIRFQQLHSMNERNGGAPDWVDQGGSGEGRASREHTSPSGSEPLARGGSKPRDERDRNILPEREKSNVSKMPDRNQVLSRLNQIRDYINQTTSLMDRMQHSRDPRVAAEYCKLTKMLLGLRDSEKKLEDLLSTLKNLAECGEIDISGGCVLESVDYEHLQRFSQLLEVLKKQEDMYLHLCSRHWGKMKQSNPEVRRMAGQPGRIISRDNEMNSQVANASYRPSDMASSVAKSAEAGHRNELKAKLQKSELEQPVQNEGVSTSQDFSRSPVTEASPVIRREKLDHLKDRIQALKELYENRNQLMELLGDEDEELSSEHHALQNKLEDLQQKKSQMDQLVQELRSLNSFIPDEDAPEASNEPLGNEAPQDLGIVENENEPQAEHDIQEVMKNMEELKHMKERLAILQGMMHVTASQSQVSGGGSVGNDGAIAPDKEDNSVNLRREVENSREAANSSKPDNISLSSEAGSIPNSDARQLYLSTQELERKTLKLQEAKLRLQQLEKLLDVMQDNRKESASLTSEHYSQLLQSVGDGEEAAGGDNTLGGGKEPDLLVNVADDQSMHSNSRKSSRKKYGSVPTDEAGSFHGSQQAQQLSRSRSSSTRGGEDVERRQNRTPSPLSAELSVEALQAMTQNLREQAMTIRSERDRLAAVKWQIAQRQRAEAMPSSPPPSSSASSSSASSFVRRVKNRNAMSIETQSARQIFLQAELQAKRRELEELMRKDRGHQTSINQDICSEISARKSEAPGFSHVTVEGTTTNATWGGSTQGTLDDLVERDIEVQDQSGGYSSDEGRNDDEAKEGTNFHPTSSFQDQRMSQLNVSLAREQQNIRSQSAQRDLLNISLDSQGRQKTSINSNNSTSNTSCTLSNVNSSSLQGISRSSHGRSPVRGSQGQIQQTQVHSTPSRNQVPTSHNVWKKDSQEGVPRAVWTPSVHARQENLCSADELAAADSSANSHAAGPPSSFPSAPSSLHQLPQSNPPSALNFGPSWWQQQAQHLQSQLEATSSLCQSLMSEQQHHGGGQGCTLPPGLPGGFNLAHPHPIGFATPPAPSSWPFPNMTPPWMLTPTSIFPGSDHSPSSFTLHSCASHQLQQQQVLLTLSQCCHLLWLQHRELASLQATVQGIQERVGHEPRPAANQDEDELRNIQMQQHPQLQQPQVLPHSLSYPNRVITPNSQTSFPAPISVAQPMPLRVGAGMVAGATLKGRPLKPSHPPASFPEAGREGMIPGDGAAAHGTAVLGATSGVSSAHSLPNLCASGAPMMGLPHLLPQTADPHLTSPGSNYPFPTDHHLPPPPHSTTSYSHADHWALHPGAAARGPPVALNNQVPPGIRANNYWDNFRSYSRQNLLSTSSKTNEGPHIPSPLVMRSHNFLRTASHGPPMPAAGLNASPVPVSQSSRLSMPVQKEKLNSEQQQTGSSVHHNTNFMAQTSGLGSETGALYGAVGFSSHDVPWESQQSPQPSHSKDDHMSVHDDSCRRHSSRERVGLFEVLRESVYSEVATLIAQNENRPHYLIQLFRDLQMISCDALRQRTLQTIHRIVSRYLQENGKEMQNEQASTPVIERENELGLKGDCDSSGDEDTAERTYRVPGEVVNYGGTCDHHSEAENKQLESVPISHPESHGIIEATGLSPHLKRRESLDGNIQSMLEQLLPLLNPHLDEPSSFMLLQNICLLAFQFLSSSINANSNKSKDNVVNTSMPFHQLNSLLEETCHSFEGCKLKDVGEELLISIGEVIIKAISSSNNVGPSTRKIPEDIEETDEESIEANAGSAHREEAIGERDKIEAEMEALHETCCDEDLAEADQSLGSGVGVNPEATESAKEDVQCDEACALPKGDEAESCPYVAEEALIILDQQRLEGDQRPGESLVIEVEESNNAESCHKNEAFLECNGNNENDDTSVAEALIDSMSISSDEVKNPAIIKADPKLPMPNNDLAHVNSWEDEEEVAIAAEEDINKNTQGDAGGNF